MSSSTSPKCATLIGSTHSDIVFVLQRAVQNPVHLIRDAFVLGVAQSKVHVLQTLCRSTLEQVINCSIDNNALARAVNSESTDLNTVLARDVLDQRRLANDLDKLLSGVAVLV
jgi:hypothetical protein